MERFLDCVASNVVVAGGLALVAVIITRIWRSPQLAHALWLLVLIKLVLPPVFLIPVGDGWPSARNAAPAEWSEAQSDLRSAEVAQGAHVPRSAPEKVHLRNREVVVEDAERLPCPIPMTAWSKTNVSFQAMGIRRVAVFLSAEWRASLCFVWAAGVLLCAGRMARRLARCRALVAEAEDAEGALVEDARAFAKRLGLRACPPVRVLEAPISPLVCAVWGKPMVLLPQWLLSALDRDQLHTVLVHELAHVRRRDHLVRWFEFLVLALFWWNPLAWWAGRRLRQAEEECCDAWVVWALPNGRRSYGKALLRTVEFLADRRVAPVVAGTPFGGSHVTRRIEMIVQRKLNRKISWSAMLVVILSAVCVLPVAAQKRPGPEDGASESRDPATTVPRDAERRDLDARIEQLERRVQELTRAGTAPAADPGKKGPVHPSEAERKAAWSRMDAIFHPLARGLPVSGDSENEEDRQLKATLLALDKEAWDAAGTGDWTVHEKLLADDYFGFYVNAAGFGRATKALDIAGVKRRRYRDANVRDANVRRIGKDVAIVTYVYDCKVEEAGQVQTYRNHQSTQVWTQKDGRWLLSFTQDFILPDGE